MGINKSVMDMVSEGIGTATRNPMLIVLAVITSIIDISSQGASELSSEAQSLVVILSLVSFVLVYAIQAYIHIEHYKRVRNADINTINRVFSQLLSLFVALIIYFVLVVVGLILLVIPGIYFALKLFLTFPICVIENESAIGSLKKSWRYTQGNLLKVLGLSFVSFLITLGVGIVAATFIFGAILLPGGVIIAAVLAVVAAVIFGGVEVVVQSAVADFAIVAAEANKDK
jgi:membrane-anchored glycerophosphoryl diester phosphodiesterase (GDPDase)